jgi:CheY-like chemotaxis protein
MGKSVLVVDDEPTIRGFVRRVLESEGFQVIEAVDGLDAMLKLRELAGNIDALVSDVKMPRMDGVSLAEAVQELYPKLPVLLMSGFVEKAAFGKPVVIRKPFTAKTLIAAIRALLS